MARAPSAHTVRNVADSSKPGARLEHARANAQVGEIMHPGVVFCVPQAPLRTVAQIMSQRRIHAVVVSDLDMPVWKHRWGVISDLDVVRAFESDVHRVTAAEIASEEPLTIGVEEPLEAAARIMAEHRVMHLVAVEGDSPRAVGVVSTLDVARVMAESRE
jgi:CBS domain-containing protein